MIFLIKLRPLPKPNNSAFPYAKPASVMKKKIVRIILIIIGIAILFVTRSAIWIYNFTQKSEKIAGKQVPIPLKNTLADLITKGSSDRSSWQEENFDKKSTFTGLAKDWSKGLKNVWEVNFLCQGNQSATWSAPVVRGNTLIVPGRDAKNDLVFCLNAHTGELFWKGSYEAKTNDNHGPGAGQRRPSTLTGFIPMDERRPCCWDLEDGKELWHKKASEIGGKNLAGDTPHLPLSPVTK